MADENNDNNAPALDAPADAAEPLTAPTALAAEESEDTSRDQEDADDAAAEAAADDRAAENAAADDAAAAADDAAAAAVEDAAAADEAAADAIDAAAQVEEAPAEQGPVEPAPAEEAAAEEAPAEETPADEGPADVASAEAAPADKTPAEPEKPAAVTAVSLGLLPEVFVSQVSTQLHFYAPEVVPLPARPGRDDRAPERDQDEPGAGRRGRRRRGGSEGDEQREEPRQRQRVVEYITEPKAIKGSTRLEAKKQRRRDGRDAGRRRPVVTEAEFLARRESVDRKMVVRSKNGRTQIGVLEDGVLVEHYVARNQDASLIGNVYLGRVQNVLPSMEAAFVDIGRGRNAVLYSGEVDWEDRKSVV